MKYAENVEEGLRKCPIHNAWIKTYRVHRAGPQIKTRYCPVCVTEKHKAEGYSPAAVVIKNPVRKITI